MNNISEMLDWTVLNVGDSSTSLRGLLVAVVVLVLTHLAAKMVRSVVRRKAGRLDDDVDSSRVYGFIALVVI